VLDLHDLHDLSGWSFAFALVLCRVGAAAMLLPGFGEEQTPAVFRAGMTVCLVALVLPGVGPVPPVEGWGAAKMVGAELMFGGLLGWLVRCIALALPVAGQVIAFMTGLSSVISPDPVLGQSTVLTRLFSLVTTLIMLTTGLWMLPVGALLHSYEVVAPGHLLAIADTAQAALGGVADMFSLALRLAAPFIAASTIWQVALGILARMVPQIQVHVVAAPGQIAGGLLLLAIMSGMLASAWSEAAQGQLTSLPGLP
jgi:flagellar biosynthetic protein FliR